MWVAPWSWHCKSSISYYFTFALCNRWQPISINLRCILHDNSVAPLGQPVCVYRSIVVYCDCGNWVVYIVRAFVPVLLINCCWLLINFKSWSKNANRFEQSIFHHCRTHVKMSAREISFYSTWQPKAESVDKINAIGNQNQKSKTKSTLKDQRIWNEGIF